MEMEFGESSAIGQNESMKLPLGFRFDPLPRELVFYLKLKNSDFTPTIKIPEVDVYEMHPKTLRTVAEIDSSFGINDNGRYYCFAKRKRRDQRGSRIKRSMKEGYWKTTSKDKDITDDKNKKIGHRKTFKFFEGTDKKPTDWIMHEFRDLNTESVMEMDSEMDASTSNENSSRIEQYVLCMIYEKGKTCPTNYPAFTQAIMKTGVDAFEEVRESSIPQNFLPESILPTSGPPSDSMVFPMVHDLSNEFSMSCDPSGNLNPPESTLLIPERPCYSNEFPMCGGISNDFSTSHDLSGNLNPPESTLLIPEHPCYNNEFPMSGGISNDFSMSHDLSGNLNPPEPTLLIPERPCYNNEFPMYGGISNDFSMSHDLSGNLNPPESTLLIPERPYYNNEFPMYGGISNDFSMSPDLSGNLNAPDGEESPLDCHSQLWNHGNL